jgi:peptidoglycan/xylan/chitin deacetylase (PgdA/CDA1 family)
MGALGLGGVRRGSPPARMLVCFDFEGSYGMPHKVPYDLHASARSILDVLARYQARAVFFVVGRMVEEHPEVVQELADAGHEIGLHGYDHDDLASYDQYRLDRLGDDLARVGSLVEQIAGARPRCFRAPYLLTPEFYRPEVSALLRANGYHWVSNQEVRYPAELLRPDRFPLRAAFRPGPGMLPGLVRSRLALTLLNAGLVAREDFLGSPAGRLSWLLSGRSPFERAGLLEVPLYAPLDCDLLGLPRPQADTPPDLLGYARAVLRSVATAPGAMAMATFHHWIVSGGNRLVLLDDALAAASDAGVDVSTTAASPHWLPAVA